MAGMVTKETSKKLSILNAGEKNSNSKLSTKQVIEIFKRSDKTISELSREYLIGCAEIRKIKHKKSWKPVTLNLTGRPGFHFKNRFEFYTKGELEQEISDLFLDDRSLSDLATCYSLGIAKIAKIKNNELYAEITKNLVKPETIYYGLTASNRTSIIQSNKSLKVLANKYGVHLETIRNIKNS